MSSECHTRLVLLEKPACRRSPGVTGTVPPSMRTHVKEEGAHPDPRARDLMSLTLEPRRRLPTQDRERPDREPVLLADALGEVMAVLAEVDPDLLHTSGSQT